MVSKDRLREAMGRALFLANRAREGGDVPVGAVVLDSQGRIVGEGWNQRERDHDPSAHAEIVALRAAGRRLGRWNLVGCTLVVTLEPCTMCAGATVQARVDRVVFAAWDPKAGAAGSVRDVLRDSRLNHRVEVIGGILEEEATIQLRGFFGSVRASSGASSSADRQPAGTVRSRPRSWERGQSGSASAPVPNSTPTIVPSPTVAPVVPPTAAASTSTRATPSRRSSSLGGPGTRGEAQLPSRRDRLRRAAAPTGSTAPSGTTAPGAPAEPVPPQARPVPRPGSPTVPGGVPPLPTTGADPASRPGARRPSSAAEPVNPSAPDHQDPRAAPRRTDAASPQDIGAIPVRRRRRGDARH